MSQIMIEYPVGSGTQIPYTSPGTQANPSPDILTFQLPAGTTLPVNLSSANVATLTPYKPTTAASLTPYKICTLNNTAQTIKASAGQIYQLHAYNPSATTAFLKLYDATTVTVGTTIPLATYGIPGGQSLELDLAYGLPFANAIKVAATQALLDTDNTRLATGLLLTALYI